MIPLHTGTTLIEASAGTGKTYTLCRIALQLTLQRGITLDRILAVTFTEAATEELASRIHELYHDCLRELETGELKEDLLVALAKEDGFDREQAKSALRYSLEVFDEAPISTIHGFCKRSLELIALEAQTPLDAELSPVEDELIEQLQNEYIRQNILESSPALSSLVGAKSELANVLQEVGRQTATHPDAILKPTPKPVSIEELDRRFCELPAAFSDLIERNGDYLPHLSARSKVRKLLDNESSPLFRAARRGVLLIPDVELLNELTVEKWTKSINKSGRDLPIPPAVSLVDTVLEQAESALVSLAFNYRSWLAKRLAEAKVQANIISFNDLLHLLHRALRDDKDGQIAALLASRYDAALIDEFQDTDRVQLQIAQRLFGAGEHYLFYIGDPKQAIYRFRGADIYAYFQATSSGDLREIKLHRNFRSAPQLVRAVNLLFSHAKAAFVDPRISFAPVEAARDDLAATSPSETPFRILQLALDSSDRPGGKAEYRRILAARAANDFARQLNEDLELRAEDVTFLVNDKLEANELSDALLQRGIASAIRADRSVFQTQEAGDLKQLLAALASPARSSLKRGAYACLNRSIDAVSMSREAFDEEATPFFEFVVEWARDWPSRNFNVAFDHLMKLGRDAAVQTPDLDAERRFSNFAQLAELLSEARDAEELSPRGLLNWLCRKADANVAQHDDWQTRISSDEGKPQILTVHKSKGLQFPFVILPFVGLKRIRENELSTSYHGPDGEYIIDFAPEEGSAAIEHARRENLAEDVRLLYVALTRAVRRNILYLCPEEIYKGSCSSFAQFLLDEGDSVASEAVASALRALAAEAEGCLSFEQSPCEPGERVDLQRYSANRFEAVEARRLENRPRLPGPERILSFSALSKNLSHSAENAAMMTLEAELENDETTPDPLAAPLETLTDEESETISIFTLPKGTRAGDLLHLILERFDFSRMETLAATTQQAFETLQFEPREFEPIVAAQIGAIAKAELDSQFGSFRLEEIAHSQRIAELEFSYPVTGDVKNGIITSLQSADPGRIPASWIESLASGEHGLSASMLRGFIDLVLERDGRLYIFDWKSNYLGPTPESYGQDAMEAAMADHNYFLQYLLYCVALKRYVAWRFPEEPFADRFGGVFYLFARGITPGMQTGIYYDLPSAELLEKLDSALAAST